MKCNTCYHEMTDVKSREYFLKLYPFNTWVCLDCGACI